MSKIPFFSSGSFTRPADTTQYSSGDLVANSTTAGSVVPIKLYLPSKNCFLSYLKLHKTQTGVTAASFRVHLYNTANTITVANGDNGAFNSDQSLSKFEAKTIDMSSTAFVYSDGISYTLPIDSTVHFPVVVDGSHMYVQALLEARNTYTPASAEVFTLTAFGYY